MIFGHDAKWDAWKFMRGVGQMEDSVIEAMRELYHDQMLPLVSEHELAALREHYHVVSEAKLPTLFDVGDEGMDANPEEDALVAQLKLDFESIGIAAPETDPRDDIIGWLATMAAVLKQKALDDGAINDEEGAETETDNNFDEEPITVQSPNFATMGLDPRQAKIVNERWRRMQAKIAASARQANAAASAAIRMSRQKTEAALKELLDTGRCSPAEHKKWVTALKAVKMSLADNGTAKPTRVDQFIEDRKALPPGAVFDVAQRLSRANVIMPTFDTTGEMTPEKAKEINDKLAKSNPGAMRREPAKA